MRSSNGGFHNATNMRVLTINAGSSSLKTGIYDASDRLIASAEIERIGSNDTPDHATALTRALSSLHNPYDAVAHRIVHGGSQYAAPQLLNDALLAELRRLIPIDPNHLPQALSLIDAITKRHANIPQIACFDTAFHRSLPRVAQMYALPPRFWDAGVRRYGFHGLSCEFIIDTLRTIDPAAAAGRTIVAHLGNGASLTAVRDGKSVETTMGFSPASGIVMGTRLGDVDPTVLVYALEQEHLSPDALRRLVNNESGLQGVSQTTHDMRDLLTRESDDRRAADAVALFCYSAKKALGALSAVLGGLDTLVFTGGIGEHAAPIRERICADLLFLGLLVDPAANRANALVISHARAPVTIRVLKTDEDRMLARHARQLLQPRGDDHV
jgi:acetate kinase